MSFGKEGVAQLIIRTHEKIQDLELFLIGSDNSLFRIGGRLGLIFHGIAILAIFKHKTDPCFLALTTIFNLAAPLFKDYNITVGPSR